MWPHFLCLQVRFSSRYYRIEPVDKFQNLIRIFGSLTITAVLVARENTPPLRTRKERQAMNATVKNNMDTTKPPAVRKYDIGGIKYVVSATVKAGANEDAATIMRRLIRNEISRKTVK